MIIIDGPSMNMVPFLWFPFFAPFFGAFLLGLSFRTQLDLCVDLELSFDLCVFELVYFNIFDKSQSSEIAGN